jgi:hypothetical protein
MRLPRATVHARLLGGAARDEKKQHIQLSWPCVLSQISILPLQRIQEGFAARRCQLHLALYSASSPSPVSSKPAAGVISVHVLARKIHLAPWEAVMDRSRPWPAPRRWRRPKKLLPVVRYYHIVADGSCQLLVLARVLTAFASCNHRQPAEEERGGNDHSGAYKALLPIDLSAQIACNGTVQLQVALSSFACPFFVRQ